MRIVALEEHATLPGFAAELEAQAPSDRGGRGGNPRAAELEDIFGDRLRLMDESGITQTVLSVPGPGPVRLAPDAGVDYARRYNDGLAKVVGERPDRFASFAHLPLGQPSAAADELERAVTQLGLRGTLISGTTKGVFLDDPAFAPLLARAEKLDVPIYIHPGVPPDSVRKAYYDGYSPHLSQIFATAGWGWHIETGVHILRMVLSGTFDKHPKLRVIVGHMGECLPFMLARCDDFMGQKLTGLPRTVSQTILDHVTITTAGFYSVPPFLAALLTFGADRIMFSIDYPFSRIDLQRAFLDALPVTPSDREKIAHRNADKLLKLV